jgi:hypothetical protein
MMSSWLEGSPICLAGHSFHRRAAAETDFATYLDEVAQARMVVQGRSLDERFGDETVTVDLRWLYAHMIDEYARHNGHADLIRELIDGATGL